jgi:hypothetical protein
MKMTQLLLVQQEDSKRAIYLLLRGLPDDNDNDNDNNNNNDNDKLKQPLI